MLDRLIERLGRARSQGGALESQGRLEEAYQWYLAAGQRTDASRVMLARAEAEHDPARRLGLLSLAIAADPASPSARQARTRKALLSLDMLRARPGRLMASEQKALAQELEEAGHRQEAAEVYGMLGDLEEQARLLAASGAIDALESTLERERSTRRGQKKRKDAWNTVKDSIATGQRQAAIALCEAWLKAAPSDEEFATLLRKTRERLVLGPCVEGFLGASSVRVALGDTICIGRTDCTITLASPALSRRHLEIARTAGGITVRDLETRNGTLLAGARLASAIEVHGPVELLLGGQIACRIKPSSTVQGVRITINEQSWLAPLGPLQVGPFHLLPGPDCVQLRQGTAASPAVLNGLVANMPIDLCRDDEIRESRDGPVLFKALRPWA
jgi:hypothetical protein